VEEDRPLPVDVVQEEDALLRSVEELLHLRGLDVGAGQALLEAVAVLLGLERPHHPRADVGEALVVEVHRVLRGEDDADALRPRLLQKREERPLRGRVGGVWREVAEDLVHVDESAQLRRARLAAHPRLHLVEEHRRHEQPLLVRQVRGVEDRQARAAVGRPQHLRDVERLALAPGLERRSGEEVVERHHEALALLAREDALERQGPDLVEGRIGHRGDQRLEREAFPRPPAVLDEVREEDRLLGLQGVGIDLQEAEEPGDHARDLVAQVALRLVEGDGRGLEGLDHVQRDARLRPRRVDRGLVRLLHGGDVVPGQAPLREPLRPRGRGVCGRRLHVLSVAPRRFGVDPRLEGGGVELLEEEQEVPEVALGIDGEHRDFLPERFLEEGDGEPGLAGARHPDNEAVREEIRGVEEHAVSELSRLRVELLAEIEAFAHGLPTRSPERTEYTGSLCPRERTFRRRHDLRTR
jgi:hypothetical protein